MSSYPARGFAVGPRLSPEAEERIGLASIPAPRQFAPGDSDFPTTPALRARLAAVGAVKVTRANPLPSIKSGAKLVIPPPKEDRDALSSVAIPKQLSPSGGRLPGALVDNARPAGEAAANSARPVQSPATETARERSSVLTPDQLAAMSRSERDFTPAELSFIKSVGGLMAPQRILDTLNGRLLLDHGTSVVPHTLAKLQKQIAVSGAVKTGDWAGMRRVIAEARKDGTLGLVTEQVVADFAVVFSLSPKQILTLKDALLRQRPGGSL